MLLTNQQKFLLDAVNRLGCVRDDQLADLIRPVFCQKRPDIAPGLVRAALRQLPLCNVELRQEGDCRCLPGTVPNAPLLDAVDVMLRLSNCSPLDYRRGTPPVLLRFTVQDISSVSTFLVTRSGAVLPEDAVLPLDRIILLFDGRGRPKALPVSNKQFFAVRQGDGTFRFFARGGP